MKKEFKLTDEQFKEFERVVKSNEEIENLHHRRIQRKLERRKRQTEMKCEAKNTCIQQ